MEHEKHYGNCGCEMSQESVEDYMVHKMIHMLIDQLNKMPPEYGLIALEKLLVEHNPLPKEVFLQGMSDLWDKYKGKE